MSAKKIPEWMREKIERLAKEKAARWNCFPADALNAWTGDALTTLRGELFACPELARVLPPHLTQDVSGNALSAMSAAEVGALLICDADASEVANVCGSDDLVEFLALKWQALSDLLAEEEGASGVHQSAA